MSQVPASAEVVRHRRRRRALAFALGLVVAPITGWGFDQLSSAPTSAQASGCYADKYGPGVPCPVTQYRITPNQERAVTEIGVACMVGAAAAAGEPVGCAYGALGAALTMVAHAI